MMSETQDRKPRTVPESSAERPNLRAKYNRLAMPAVVAAIIPKKWTERREATEKPRRDYSRD